jgi:hypothetical protein
LGRITSTSWPSSIIARESDVTTSPRPPTCTCVPLTQGGGCQALAA